MRHLDQFVEELAGVEAKHLGDVEKLDEIDPTLARLDVRHERLMPAKFPGEVALLQPRTLPISDEQLGQAPVTG